MENTLWQKKTSGYNIFFIGKNTSGAPKLVLLNTINVCTSVICSPVLKGRWKVRCGHQQVSSPACLQGNGEMLSSQLCNCLQISKIACQVTYRTFCKFYPVATCRHQIKSTLSSWETCFLFSCKNPDGIQVTELLFRCWSLFDVRKWQTVELKTELLAFM